MNRSTLLCKPFRSIKFSTTILCFSILSGCHILRPDQAPLNQSQNKATPLSLGRPMRAHLIPVLTNSETAPGLLATLSSFSCRDGDSQRWQIPLKTAVGEKTVLVEIPPESNQASVTIDHHQFQMQLAARPPEGLVESLCSWNEIGTEDSKISSDEFHHTVRNWLAQISPDCRIQKPSLEGWPCRVPSVNPQTVEKDLRALAQTMIRRWTRQPYLLTRRLFVTRMLASAMSESDPLPAFQRQCRIMKHSLDIELPLVLASKRWQASFCAGPLDHRWDAAHFGLSKAFAEIQFMRRLFEKTIAKGLLSIRLPRDQFPGRDVWVSLSPTDRVATSLAKQAATIWQGKNDRPNQSLPQTCWHPVFSESKTLLLKARLLGLTGDARLVQCDSDETNLNDVAHYIADSIASETEFVVTNGRNKLLRLPRGTYDYSVQVFTGDPTDPPMGDPETTRRGQIQWSSRSPHPKIATW